MTLLWTLAGAAAVTGATVATILATGETPSLISPWTRYNEWWSSRIKLLRLPSQFVRLPALQGCAILLLSSAGIWLSFGPALPGVVALAAIPPVMLRRQVSSRRAKLTDQLDGMITALSNALSTTPNLTDALSSIVDHLDSPMRDEIRSVLSHVKLGRTVDEALMEMATRTHVPGFEPAVAAAIMGRRTGGDLPTILESTARTLREIARLEGVVRTKTAEGRNQALVMGLVPPFLVVALHKIDPSWLEPMWHDPIGWVLLGVASVLEISAIMLIRKIMAVEI